MPDHGAIHGLEYIVKSNGETVTKKTKENHDQFMRSIASMPDRKNIRWFYNGTFQGNTDREFPAVHIYDMDQQIIAVFKKETGQFVTTCQLSLAQHLELVETGNFGGGKGWFSGKAQNVAILK